MAIDVETGDWAVADTTRHTRLSVCETHGVPVLSISCVSSVGYRALRSFGAGSHAEDRVIEGVVTCRP